MFVGLLSEEYFLWLILFSVTIFNLIPKGKTLALLHKALLPKLRVMNIYSLIKIEYPLTIRGLGLHLLEKEVIS